MDRSKKLDKQALYEIYRACRLCGAGAGYKMPIIQNLVKVDGEIVELKQKILECLQLEVNSNDKMPPLICELCVDKVDDFYDFLTACRETNRKTRNRLGLPSQDTPTTTKVTPASVKVNPAPKKVVSKDIGTETCMLGLIEATSSKQDIFVDSRQSKSKKSKKTKGKLQDIQQESLVKPENMPTTKNLALKDIKQGKEKDNKRKREPSPKRTTRQSNSLDDLLMIKVQEPSKNQAVTKPSPFAKPGPKSRKIETKDDTTPFKTTRAKEKEEPPPKYKEDEPPKSKAKRHCDEDNLTKLKRIRDRDSKTDLTPPPPAKKAKSMEPPKTQKSSKSSPKPVQIATTVLKTVQPDGLPCPACNSILKNIVGFKNHMNYTHPVTWTPDNLACNACRDWFPTIEESISHHKKHNYYRCLRCKRKYKNGVLYHQHIENKRCLPEVIVPDIKCDNCTSTFATSNLFKSHRCLIQNERQPVKCGNCNRKFTSLKNHTKHKSICCVGKKVEETPPVIDPDVKKLLIQMQVRITKCDELLQYGPVVSACTVPHRFGLDRKMSYPYMPKLRVIKQPTFNPMVEIQDEIKEEYNTDDFNWGDFEYIELRTIKKLSTLCLKVIFSEQMLGELEILDEIEITRRTALKKRIDSIIFKFDDASSNNSDSLLDKNALTETFEVVNDRFESSDKISHSDSTVFDETSAAGEVGKDSDVKIDDFDRDFVDNHINSVNLGIDDGRIDNYKLNSNVLSKTDVDINKTYDTNTVNVTELSNEHLERNETLNDVTSSNLSAVSEDLLVNKLENSTDTGNEEDIYVNNIISSSNDSLSVINTENSTNLNCYTVVTENRDILSKNDVDLNIGDEIGTKITNNAKTIENTGLSNEALQNNKESEAVIKENKSFDSENTCKDIKEIADYNNDSNLNNYVKESEKPHDSVIESNDHDKLSVNHSDLIDYKSKSESMETDTEKTNFDNNSLNNDDTMRDRRNSILNDSEKNEIENMDIDETCSKNSLHFENSDTYSLENVSSNKIDTDIDQSADADTKNPETIKNTENNPSNDSISPQKANKSLDFSVTGILNHVTSKNLDTNLNNIGINEPIENDTKQDAAMNKMNDAKIIENDDNSSIENDSDNKIAKTETNDTKINDNKQFPLNDDNSSVKNDSNNEIEENEINNPKMNNDDQTSSNLLVNDGNSIVKNDYYNEIEENEINNPKMNNDDQSSSNLPVNDDDSSVKNDSDNKKDTISLNNTSITGRTEDTISINSIKYTENVKNSDKFNMNDLSDDERKLMAELDEQIGETNDKIEKLTDGKDLNLDNFNDGYNFD